MGGSGHDVVASSALAPLPPRPRTRPPAVGSFVAAVMTAAVLGVVVGLDAWIVAVALVAVPLCVALLVRPGLAVLVLAAVLLLRAPLAPWEPAGTPVGLAVLVLALGAWVRCRVLRGRRVRSVRGLRAVTAVGVLLVLVVLVAALLHPGGVTGRGAAVDLLAVLAVAGLVLDRVRAGESSEAVLRLVGVVGVVTAALAALESVRSGTVPAGLGDAVRGPEVALTWVAALPWLVVARRQARRARASGALDLAVTVVVLALLVTWPAGPVAGVLVAVAVAAPLLATRLVTWRAAVLAGGLMLTLLALVVGLGVAAGGDARWLPGGSPPLHESRTAWQGDTAALLVRPTGWGPGGAQLRGVELPGVYLQVLADLGPAGLLTLLAGAALLVRLGVDRWRRDPQRRTAGAVCAVVGVAMAACWLGALPAPTLALTLAVAGGILLRPPSLEAVLRGGGRWSGHPGPASETA